jgi:hypothetical protein
MTDTSSLLPNSVGISSDCLYNLKPSGVRSRSYRASVLATNGVPRAPGDVIIAYIPGGRRNTYLDCTQSYIRYTVQNNDSSNTMTFDGCGASVINRLDIFHGSNLLESVQQYNVLYNYVMDFQTTQSQRLGLSTAYGFDDAGTRQGGKLAVSACNTVCMPLLSGVVGLGNSKMMPLGMLSDDIRLEFTLEQALLGMVYSTANNPVAWSISAFELELCIVELSDEGENMVRSMTSPEQPIYIHGNSWRHYTSTTAGAAGGFSTIVPARFASLKSLVMCPRRGGVDMVANSYSISSRVNPNIASYWWRVGSAIVPAKNITLINNQLCGNFSESFMEAQRAWHSINSAENASCLTSAQYNVSDTVTPTYKNNIVAGASVGITTYGNGFVIAQELESFAQRSDVLLSGLNTLSSQVFFESNITTACSACTNWTLDFYANFDHILVLERGLLSVRF